ncbi:MAG TPA: MTAP family purine nucleoside phosphorylase [Pseudolysinimonas sp.]|nr:MTAP family purine nucleoside phosphorylase [Pseudolysinimonas sp.]
MSAPIGVIGGSGLYRLMDAASSESRTVATPYGPAAVVLGEFAGRPVAFLTRHGADHSVAPHLIPYQANIWALASLGVRAIVSSSAVGGLTAAYPPGSLVLTDQFIDRTHGRADTFFDRPSDQGGSVQHLPAADPFDPALHRIARAALTVSGEMFIPSGTAVVIQGPRFSTRAESRWFAASGGHIINMTMCPEVPLAAELGIGTVNLAFVTDSDAGVDPAELPADSATDADAVSHQLVLDRLAAAQPRIVAAIETILRAIPEDYPGVDLIPAEAVAGVLGREVLSREVVS